MNKVTLYIIDHIVNEEKVQGLFSKVHIGQEVTLELLGVLCENGDFLLPKE